MKMTVKDMYNYSSVFFFKELFFQWLLFCFQLIPLSLSFNFRTYVVCNQ